MAEEKKKAVVLRSAPGIARYAWLSRPDTKFDDAGKYKMDLELDPNDEAAKTFLNSLKDQLSEQYPNPPYKAQKDKTTEEPTGNIIVKFASGFKPKLFDLYGSEMPDNVVVGSGSKVVVAYTISYYKGFGGGMNLYLQAVQVVDLKEYDGRSADEYGFDVAKNVEEDKAPWEKKEGETQPPEDVDNLPF